MSEARLRVAKALATWFGCGLVPKVPGTMGTVGALPLYWLVARGGPLSVGLAAVAVTGIGIWAATQVERHLGTKDPQIVVIDEVAGMLFTMVPIAAFSWRATAVGFVLFRLLDMTKPWPIRRFEALPSGWGIVLDDVAAGIVGAGVMLLLRSAAVLP